MNRRQFISRSPQMEDGGTSLRISDEGPDERTPRGLEYANKEIPRSLQRTQAGMERYSGSWDEPQVSHLLKRTLFGAKRSEIEDAMTQGMDATVDQLLKPWSVPDPPIAYQDETYRDAQGNLTTALKAGEVWVTAPYNGSVESYRNRSLQAWWTGLMLNQGISLREKMTLFWHNHFVSEYDVVSDSRLMYKQNALLRDNAFGNFKELVKLITLDPAMLRYLNGNTNTKGKPNENYARELQELFTIGKGLEIAPGNYTNYTEADVITAAKVLTGWRDDRTNLTTTFSASNHDTSDKTFSAAYQSRTIKGGTGTAAEILAHAQRELDELLDMIFEQLATAEYIIRKLYRWFVYYIIDDAAEQNVIKPLAGLLRNSNYEIKPVLATLFKSAHFFDAINRGCVIKNPLDHVLGITNAFSIQFPGILLQDYRVWDTLRATAATQQMDLLLPPNVAGWPAYWQEPVFYEIWLNSDTIPKRFTLTDTFVNGVNLTVGTNPTVRFMFKVDAVALTQQLSDPSDPNIVVAEHGQFLFPEGVTDSQKTELKKFLAVENQDYDWTNEWNAFTSNPTSQNRLVVENKLKSLLKYMLTMAEFQLV